MLIQLPGGSSDQPGLRETEDGASFETGLRRDLASAPVVSYDAMLGGWPKRAVDLTLVLLSSPVWLVVLFAAAAWAKLRHRAKVFCSAEQIGYGGRAFKCYSLRVDRDVSVADLKPANEPVMLISGLAQIADGAEGQRAKWRRFLERLPQLFNVIKGDMSLVGPRPLTREQLEPLKSARRYYLSMRPGIVGVGPIANSDHDEPSFYKLYAMSWALSMDVLILWDALRSLRNRGELWRPSLRRPKANETVVAPTAVVNRRRGSSSVG